MRDFIELIGILSIIGLILPIGVSIGNVDILKVYPKWVRTLLIIISIIYVGINLAERGQLNTCEREYEIVTEPIYRVK